MPTPSPVPPPRFPVRYTIDLASAGSLRAGLQEIMRHLPARFSEGEAGQPGHRLSFQREPGLDGCRIERSDSATTIFYGETSMAFRGLALATGSDAGLGVRHEKRQFAELGLMLDVSRNSVLTLDALKRLFRHFALMGYNSVQLYMEDTYEIEGEPLFGYFRGRYTQAELKEIDAYGADLGIEVIPCIQTLGHLEQILRWPFYRELVDAPGVLMVGEERTYRLVTRMLDTVSSCFRSRRVHIGMDEAHGIALGNYRLKHGECRPFDVLSRHLKTVAALCEERGLKPMIWSDMYFRLGSAKNDYYDKESRIPESVAAEIPAGVDLVYWDYYHDDPAFYTDWIARHRKLGKEPIWAGGGWSWCRMWVHYGLAEATISAGIKGARAADLKRVFLTLWGDDGNECDPFSMLWVAQYFAEVAFTPEADQANERLKTNFAASCEENLEWLRLGGELDIVESLAPPHDNYANFGKWVLWHDPLHNFLEKLIPAVLPSHYDQLVAKLRRYQPARHAAIHHEFACLLAETLASKTRLHLGVRPAYHSGNRGDLEAILALARQTATLCARLKELHRTIWHQWRKPFGWDALERRYASLLSRLESLSTLLEARLGDPTRRIPELEETPREIGGPAHPHHHHLTYANVCSASTLL